MALSPEIRKKLQELNRNMQMLQQRNSAAAPVNGGPRIGETPAPAGQCVPAARQNPLAAPPKAAGPVKLEEAAPGEALTSPFGKAWLIRKDLSCIMPDGRKFVQDYANVFGGAMAWREGSLHRELRPLLSIDPQRVLFLDIETTGLTAMPVFLIGVMQFGGHDFHLHQFFARDYSEERAMIAAVAERLPHFEALVTFNGKSFDVPYIRDRGLANGLHLEYAGLHLDLLHEARRRWRGRLPDCRLQTLERHLCNRVRIGDIPGELIPQAYHDFVRSGDAYQMSDVIHHNALDLIAMSEILLHMIKESPE